jgi:signal peptidase I
MLPLLIVLGFIALGFNTDYIPSGSMEPTLVPGDHIITMRAWLAYPFGQMPSRGDVITFRLSDAARLNDPNDNGDVNAATQGAAGAAGATGAEAPAEILIKRVVGLPGDSVQIVGNIVYINGQRLVEAYDITPMDVSTGTLYPYAVDRPLKVPQGELFVLGDNRNNSDDGRFWGTLKRSDVIGRYVAKLFHQNPQEAPNGKPSGP